MMGHRLMGQSLLMAGNIVKGRAHFDRAIALYDPPQHRPLATRFGQDVGVTVRSFRSWALWLLGYPEAAIADTNDALKHARETGDAASLMPALGWGLVTNLHCGDYPTADALADELFALAGEKGSLIWKASMTTHGCVMAVSGRASDAVQMITSGAAAWRSIGSTIALPMWLTYLARAYAELGQFDDAWRYIHEVTTATETTKETWYEAESQRTAGELALMSPESDAAKAEAYFERALAVAREQQARSWELRAAVSMTRLWRDQGKRQQAHDLLAAIYTWFTEGFDTLDLKEAKALLDELV
jgi:predicted ATPase